MREKDLGLFGDRDLVYLNLADLDLKVVNIGSELSQNHQLIWLHIRHLICVLHGKLVNLRLDRGDRTDIVVG